MNIGTLKYWASKDSPEEFKNYQMNEIDTKLTITIEEDGNTSYDIAKYYMNYTMIHINAVLLKDTWYEFKNQWRKMGVINYI